jgi:2-polyprenyl-3-methyl-5-hydroxy-6-metoxy-1,4-benzoquinol methylase
MDHKLLDDTGERILPTKEGETSLVYARHRFAYQYVSQFVAGKEVVDIGCGTGYGCSLLSEKSERILGIDYDASAVDYCQKNYGKSNIEFRNINACSLKLNEQFDVAISFQVIEHIADLSEFIQRIKNVVRPNGTIFISTPNVRKTEKTDNPFHCNEMDYGRFNSLLSQNFDQFKVFGVTHASPNKLRSLIQLLHLYRLGRVLKRNSKIKRIATNAMGLTQFRIIETEIDKNAIDLLAVCTNVR